MLQNLQEKYGGLFEDALLSEISEVGSLKNVKEGAILIDLGQYITTMPLVLSGAIKVLREDKDGDELLLYYLEAGETCAMTLSCCIGSAKSEIRAIAETDSKLIMIPVQKMEEWTGKYKKWRNFVFESYHGRLQELLEAIDTIAFLNLDQRLLKYLKEKSRVSNTTILNITHQQIAYELHTSRVVISRLLKKLEKLNKISLHRNHITLKDI